MIKADKKKTTQRNSSKDTAAPKKKNATKSKMTSEVVGHEEQWCLRLYVAGQTPRSIAAISNLQAFCKEHLDERYKVEVIDLVKDPQRARVDQIVAIPTLVRRIPAPVKKIIGDLSQKERVLVGFDLQPSGEMRAKAS
jgi:circadian clock protein KaiB